MRKSKTRFKGIDPHNTKSPHIGFENITEGWPGSGFARCVTEMRARRVDHGPAAYEGDNEGEEVQFELSITHYFDSGRSRAMHTSMSLPGELADKLIAHIQRKETESH